jgi:trehalose 6-phosphate synthase
MPRAERRRRWEALIDGVRAEDVGVWRERFVAALLGTDHDNDADERPSGPAYVSHPPAA